MDNQWQQTCWRNWTGSQAWSLRILASQRTVDVVTLTGHVETFAEKPAGQVISVANDVAIC